MSDIDTQLLKEKPERALMHLSPIKDDQICWPDATIKDGDVIELGNTRIRCVSAPGHTPGTMAFFFEATDATQKYKIGYLGGLDFLSIYKEFCRQYDLPQNMCEQMKQTAQKLMDEEVDIVLGNHPNHNCLIEKREYMKQHPNVNPFINKNTWKLFLQALNERCLDFERKGY